MVHFNVDFDVICSLYPKRDNISKHGAQECYGNMQELCYKHVHGSETWLPFIQCMNTDRAAIGTDEWAKTCGKIS